MSSAPRRWPPWSAGACVRSARPAFRAGREVRQGIPPQACPPGRSTCCAGSARATRPLRPPASSWFPSAPSTATSRPCWPNSARPAAAKPLPTRPSSVSSTPRTGSRPADLSSGYRCRPRPGGIPLESGRIHHGLTKHLVRPLNGGTMTIDQDKLTEFLNKFVGDLGATMAAGNVLVGDRLGFYRALAGQPMLPCELAEHTGTATRYVDEWLRGQAAGGYVQYNPQTGSYSLTPEQAFALTDPDGAVFAPGAFELALGALRSEQKVIEAFRTGAGVGWHEHDDDVFSGCERFFRPGYAANLVASWLPALDGVQAKLNAGAAVADVGCGHGASTTLMARAFGKSRFTGSDYPEGTIIQARKRAADAGPAPPGGYQAPPAQNLHRGP